MLFLMAATLAAMPRRLAILASALTPAAKAVRLLPAGSFRSADGSGRPSDAPAWRLDAALARALIARASGRADRKVVDYEHQTLKSGENGQPAPAAGWMTALEWREPAKGIDGQADEPGGLYMVPEWTERAAAMIAGGEYRYISPVFAYDSSGNVNLGTDHGFS